MNCNWSYRISSYYDGELSPPAARDMEAHLAECEQCRRELADLRALSPRLAAAGMAEPSDEMMERWKAGTGRQQDRSIRRMAGWMTAAAAALLFASILRFGDGQAADLVVLGPIDRAFFATDEPQGPTYTAARWMAADLSMEGGAQ
jgi:anti-sigma factor RsiW